MDNPNLSISPKDVSEIVKTAKEVLPQTVSETDGAISTMVGLFNNVVLYPVKRANIYYRYKLECFEKDLRQRMEQVPADNICEPKISIAGPTLEALKYTYDEQDLREMYVNLLASSMDSAKTKDAHPSFVEIIKRMDPLDARLMKQISIRTEYIRIINSKISCVDDGTYFVNAIPEWFTGITIPGYDIFQISTSLVRLDKLGIIDLLTHQRTKDKDKDTQIYHDLEQSESLQNILNTIKSIFPDKNIILSSTKSLLSVNEYGKQFIRCCI
ncbi:MAG: DUF4393 domain-containing protein [Sphaerochaetaceae bacterium]|nr:DUF4393 domain-containing protein [uncultured Sphaerochaeta sp.]MDC7229732.1 DUF4393 domain-containing protein [Sphaerochaetaceae bacterium]